MRIALVGWAAEQGKRIKGNGGGWGVGQPNGIWNGKWNVRIPHAHLGAWLDI